MYIYFCMYALHAGFVQDVPKIMKGTVRMMTIKHGDSLIIFSSYLVFAGDADVGCWVYTHKQTKQNKTKHTHKKTTH